jgi:glyoxylase-like metal-dependent hydrolase (beta-lactamase superfamily II)
VRRNLAGSRTKYNNLSEADMRAILKLWLAFCLIHFSAGLVRAQDDVVRTADVAVRGLWPSDFPRLKKLADRVYVYEELQTTPPLDGVFTTNSFIVITDDGVLIADGQGTGEQVQRLVATIAKLTPQPIKYMIIGADHGDHTGGNYELPKGVAILAHPNAKPHLEAYAKRAIEQTGKSNVVMPTEFMTDQKKVIELGGQEIDILFQGRAHTGSDLEVFLPRENIMFMSEVFFNRLYPSTYSGYPSEWIETLKKAESMHAALYVPGHGFVDSPQVLNQEMVNFRLCLENLVAEGKRMHDSKIPVESAPRFARLGSYQYWTRAANNLPDGLRRVYMEIDGQLK